MLVTDSIKIAGRVLLRNRLISGINFAGLSVGICAVLFIAVYIQRERSYDDFHQKGERIFRAGFTFWEQGKQLNEGLPEFSAAFGPAARDELPEVEDFCRVSESDVSYIVYDNNSFKTAGLAYTDPSFFHLFSFELLEGDPSSVLDAPFSIVLNRSTAVKLFGSVAVAPGKSILLNGKKKFMVTGVIEDMPANTEVKFSSLLSFSSLYSDRNVFLDWNGGYRYTTYLLLDKPENVVRLEKKLPAFMWRHVNQNDAAAGIKTDACLQPLREVHLKYNSNSDTISRNLAIFSTVALFILLISCVNYINFNLAQSFTRAKEIGIRKVLGAGRKQLMMRFTGESVLLTGLSFIAAVLLYLFMAPLFSRFTSDGFSFTDGLFSRNIAIGAGLLFTLISMGSGIYLALYLPGMNIHQGMKAEAPGGRSGVPGRLLIIVQFMISIALMTCTFIVYRQVTFIQTHPTGIDREHILVVSLSDDISGNVTDRIGQETRQLSNVSAVTALSELPVSGITRNGFIAEGQSQVMMIHQLDADENLLTVFGLKLSSGTYFRKGTTGHENDYVINQTLARQLGWKDPVGKVINRNGQHRVTGVVEDFNFASLHERIGPLIITTAPWNDQYRYLAIRYHSDPSTLISTVQNIWRKSTAAPFDYRFLDAEFDSMYKSEQQFMSLLLCFSLLSLFLSLSGVFGLVYLTIRKRLKEISIRRILGASVSGIVSIASSRLIASVCVAALAAIPASWYFINQWLGDFAYRAPLHWWMFGAAGLLVIVVTLITISIQVLKALSTRPAEVLRNE